mmetsp:Transcript_33539/g.74230  ORF Transcript_33539/g.74230 Transcript_33539/m.74230 type:complete len:218 (-) Transcript_33539:3045-3698(-)
MRQRLAEEREEDPEAELVHVVDGGQVLDEEVHDGAALSNGAVHVALLVQALLQRLGLCEGLGNGDALGLGLVEAVQQLLVVQQVACACGQVLEQALLQVRQLHLELLLGAQQLALLGLQLGLLALDGEAQQLALQAGARDGEVGGGHQAPCVRGQVGVGVTSHQVQPEGFIEVNCLVSNLHHEARTLAVQVHAQQRVQDGLDLVHLSHHQRLAEPHR